jgi:subtilisin family serine protease
MSSIPALGLTITYAQPSFLAPSLPSVILLAPLTERQLQDFGGRAKWGVNLITGSQDTDTSGHGTHVSGTIGGTTFGVAKNVSLVSVKVYPDGINPTTLMSTFITALEWVVGDALLHGNINKSVVNISSRGPQTIALNMAIATASRLGLAVVVAAGNDAVSPF